MLGEVSQHAQHPGPCLLLAVCCLLPMALLISVTAHPSNRAALLSRHAAPAT